jgi:D-3-phosphoglycerate dehydrogenase / 2-oxoglutarate reductase
VLADHQVNVEGQVLVTRDQLGYVLTDVSSDYAPDVLQVLQAMPETVRLRVLS